MPKYTIYNQENPDSYVDPTQATANVAQFPDRMGERHDEEGVVFSLEVWKRFSRSEKAVVLTMAATAVASVAVMVGHNTLGDGIRARYTNLLHGLA